MAEAIQPADTLDSEKELAKKQMVENIACHASTFQYSTDDTSRNNYGEENKHSDSDSYKSDQQKVVDGKTMQKQKNKSKVKGRELNRRGAEKEGTDMDAFVNSASSLKIESKQDSSLEKDMNKGGSKELTKDIKEKDNYESRKEKDFSEVYSHSVEKTISSIDNPKENIAGIEKEVSQKSKNNKENRFEDSHSNTLYKDVVDHITVYRTKIDNELPSIVVQKNEENSKVSGLFNDSKEGDKPSKIVPVLKYTYADDQWSPINTNGKKVYGREFLMKLQNDPCSKIKPSNLPDLDVVLKDSTKTRSPVDLRFKDDSLRRHDALFASFVKSSLNAKVPPPSKKSHSGKPKASKPNVIHVSLSLREEVKLRETENAWKPTRLVQTSASEEQNKTEILYKKVRSVLNKLTPQKFNTLVNQVRELQIDTQERLQGVIDLVFEKAVDEPNFSVAYALMCKELSNIEVPGADFEDSSSANFRKLILTRCQTEFEKNTVDETARSEKLKEIEECNDAEKKKELQMNLEEEERRIRIKSVGNIRFIGELFKQNMLTCKIMHQCIRHLLNQVDEENLECLCKLLTTIGKVLESKQIDLSDYFKQMQQIANRKGKISSRIRFMLQDVIDLRANKWIPRRDDSNPKTMDQIQREAESERQEIQLNNSSLNTPRKDDRGNERKRNRGGTGSIEDGGWSQPVGRPRQYAVETAKLKNKPPSMDDIQLGSRAVYQWSKPNPKMPTPSNKYSYLENLASESEKRGPSIHLSGSRSTGPRDYGRLEYKPNYEGRNSRNGSYQASSTTYNRESSAVENSRSQSLSSMNSAKSMPQSTTINNAPQLSEDEMHTALNSFFEEYVAGEEDVEEAIKAFRTVFPVSSHTSFVHEIINAVLEKSDYHRNKTSQLLAQLLLHKCISLSHFKAGIGRILEAAGDLLIDIPKLWKYFAEILVNPVINNSCTLSDIKNTLSSLTSKLSDEQGLEFVAVLLFEITKVKGKAWVITNWIQSGLQWTDLAENQETINRILAEYKLEFLTTESCKNFTNDISSVLSIEEIHDRLLTLFKDNNFDDIIKWIQVNVGDRVKDPKFIRILMTSILETSVEQCNDKWTFKVENFDKLQKLIQRYVDADDYLELQCLFAVQAYVHRLSHPAGLILKIMTHLCENNVLSNEAFLAWEKDENPAEREGKPVALVTLKSFFIPLKEVEDITSGEDA